MFIHPDQLQDELANTAVLNMVHTRGNRGRGSGGRICRRRFAHGK